MGAMMPQTTIATKLTALKPDALTLEITFTTTQMGQSSDNKTTRTIPAKVEQPATAPATQAGGNMKNIKEGKETLDINGKKIDTITREYDSKMSAAGTHAASHIKVWTSATFPGGTVKSETTTQIQQMGNVTTSTMVTDFNIVQ